MSSRVSIVIPTRDRGAPLVEAVESARALEPREIVVVDGGARNASVAQVESMPGVRVLRGSFANAAMTRNAGAAATSAPYLGFLDSDDRALPGKVARLAEMLDEEGDVGLAHGHMSVIDSEGRPDPAATCRHTQLLERARAAGTAYADLAESCVMFTSATLVRRTAFESIGGYDESISTYEDWDLYLRLSLGWRLVYDDLAAAEYRIWEGNVAWDETARGVARVARKHLEALPVLAPRERRRARYAFNRRIAESEHILLNRGETRSAVRAAIAAAPPRGLRDRALLSLFMRTFAPAAVLGRRRPPPRTT